VDRDAFVDLELEQALDDTSITGSGSSRSTIASR